MSYQAPDHGAESTPCESGYLKGYHPIIPKHPPPKMTSRESLAAGTFKMHLRCVGWANGNEQLKPYPPPIFASNHCIDLGFISSFLALDSSPLTTSTPSNNLRHFPPASPSVNECRAKGGYVQEGLAVASGELVALRYAISIRFPVLVVRLTLPVYCHGLLKPTSQLQ